MTENISKHKIGARVRVKNTLTVGSFYEHKDGSGDYFTPEMEKYKGQEATVLECVIGGYFLDISPEFKFSDAMLLTIVDSMAQTNAILDHQDRDFVILATMKSHIDNLSVLLDKALDDKDEESFMSLSKLFNDYVKDYEELLKECS